ncbi:sialate O-acetylesterase [Arcicella aurantiaca]|uniref:Sialate O-acetylesterase n=1 Tax=Arcicella aurantiaca TaxID=591202 RepID=A0A316EWT6_9BACT|nr:sialate O-acetylesterase [Arcicella aurantiaca]PWK27641.1 sialate O-acetylesterase [Arcicella aurantiaca]
MKQLTLIFLSIFLTNINLNAQIILPRVLGHNMVLQRNKPVQIWGKASVGEQVSVQFAGQNKTTKTDSDGNWSVTLKALKTSNKPSEMVITGKNTIKLQNILVGEVWLCSGQSNMEYTMRKNSKVTRPNVEGQNPVDELQFAKNPNIRIFLVNRKELVKPDSLHRGWSIAKDSALRSFSAVGYFFAKEINLQTDVPIGMISSAIPGSRIEPWISEEAFAESAYYKNQKVDGEPAKFYNPMIRPLEKLAMRGFLWYQGESNCFLKDSTQYTHKLETLIKSWRNAWHDEKMPFYYVQIVPYLYSSSKGKVILDNKTLPTFWEAQANVSKILSKTDYVTTTDLIDSLTELHPSYKWEIGKRLALLALKNDYDKKGIIAQGPEFEKIKIDGDKAIITFKNAENGLLSKDGKALTFFELAANDGHFVKANAQIEGNSVVVTAPNISKPKSVRFAWDETAKPNLFNQAGLPARPFRTK